MKKITIAIDGHSSTGKSTIARELARELEYVYVDSGAMYRAVTLHALKRGLISKNEFHIDDLILELDKLYLSFNFNENLGFSEIYLNDINVEEEIRTMKVSNFVSKVSEIPEIRRQLVRQQQKMRNQGGIVMDGRDIGTVVFPDAHLKLFITASPEIRAKRRFKELIEGGEKVFFSDVLKNIVERDYLDSHREDSPLRKAKDAIEIDNSLLTLKEQYLKIRSIVKQTLIHLK